jgi:hypothetical protein
MHGHEATRLEQSVSDLKERWSEFCDACEGLGPYAEADPRCRAALSKAVNAADHLRGALEDLADEVPAATWEGLDDV